MRACEVRVRQWSAPVLGKPLTRVADFCLGVPLLQLLSVARFKRRRIPPDVHRVGVLCSPTMGDTVLLSGPLLDLRAHFGSEVEIVQFCGKKNILAAELLEGASRRVVIDLTKPMAAAKKMRAEKLDLLLDFSSWQRVTAILALLSGSRYTVGFRSRGQYRARGYDRTVEHRADQHELDNFRDLLRGMGIAAVASPQISVPDVPLPDPWRAERDIVVFHPWPAGGPGSMREWPEEHWFRVARALGQPETVFAITGSPMERTRSEAFAARLEQAAGVRALAFGGGDGLRQLVTLMRRARVVIAVNTGVMHLAAVAGAPTVSLNGPTAEHRWGPRGGCCASVAPADGSGGYLHFGFEFHGRMPDVMPRILPEQVIAAAVNLAAGCGQSDGMPIAARG